jgi:SAM-dependent methyltransferase
VAISAARPAAPARTWQHGPVPGPPPRGAELVDGAERVFRGHLEELIVTAFSAEQLESAAETMWALRWALERDGIASRSDDRRARCRCRSSAYVGRMARDDAQEGFHSGAQAYVRARPAYPDVAVTSLMNRLELAAGGHVVDLGAGTGIFSRQLVSHGVLVTAVEPVPAMRAEMSRVPGLVVHNAVAERTGLPDGCADAVVAATAWHWFDAAATIREVRRLLKPGAGGLGLVWNDYDVSVPWVGAYAGIADRRRPATTPSARSGLWREFFDALDGWAPLTDERFANPLSTTSAGLVDRLLSSSAIARLPAPEQAVARAEVVALLEDCGLDDAESITLPYVTTICWTRPASD